jgi:hypothetical protein
MKPTFWLNWLRVAVAGTGLFGLTLVWWPWGTQAFFNWMIFQDPAHSFGVEAERYLVFVYGVLGATIAGWSASMWMSLRSFQADHVPRLALPLLLWFSVDTSFSLYSGYWQNAVLNASFILLFAPPLLGLWRRK